MLFQETMPIIMINNTINVRLLRIVNFITIDIMFRNLLFGIFFLTGIGIVGCQKPEVWSDIPEINYKDCEVKDSLDALSNSIKLCRLTIQVKDGDGDIGLDPADTTGIRSTDSLHHNDLFLTLFSKKNGIWSKVNLALAQNFRIPYVDQQGQNKSLKADIVVKLEYPVVVFKYDTIAYDVFIFDRALHKSNIIRTPEIITSITKN